MILKKLMDKIEKIYPLELAEEWDNCGLQIGEPNQNIENILTVLEITEAVVEEALEKNIDLIVAHHPLILFDSIKVFNFSKSRDQLIQKLIKNDIALYVMHTNVDIASGGMNDWLAQELKIKNTNILSVTHKTDLFKVSIEINGDHVDELLGILNELGISKSRSNRQNLLMSPKIKRFQRNNNNKIHEIDVVVVEFNSTEEEFFTLKHYFKKLKYEKKINITYDITPLKFLSISNGIGRYGDIKPQTLEDFANKISRNFKVEDIRIVGSREKIIKKVAVVGGSGKKYIKDAYYKKCDVLVTGDLSFHDAQYALSLGISLIDAGHYLEIIFNDAMEEFLRMFDQIKVFSSEIDTNPFEKL